jgi:hypothetical protein
MPEVYWTQPLDLSSLYTAVTIEEEDEPEPGCTCWACTDDRARARREAQRERAEGDREAALAAADPNICADCGMWTDGRSRYRACRCDDTQCARCGYWESDGCECANYCADCGDYTGGRETCLGCLGGRINSYGYKPAPIFHGNGPLFLGMELEMETRDKLAAAETAMLGFGDLVYLKEDGSIRDGFEMVTHPMDHGYAMDRVDWSTLDRLAAAGAFVRPDSNGLHVHVSRDGFDCDSHVYRWMKLLYRNQRMMRRVARRNSDSWAAWTGSAQAAQRRTAKKRVTPESQNAAYHTGRYNAINTLPDATLEVRVFASSLNPAEVTGTLSLVASTVEYTRKMTAHDVLSRNAWSWPAYVSWLRSEDGKPFTPATTYLESVCAC